MVKNVGIIAALVFGLSLDCLILTGTQEEGGNWNGGGGNWNHSGLVNGNSTFTGRRRRRPRRRPRRRVPDGAATAGGGETTSATTGGVEAATAGGEQTDLSGVYSGTINFPGGDMSGDAVLSVSGNRFTLTSGSKSRVGRLSAVTTRGYTGVALQFDDESAGAADNTNGGAATAPPLSVSTRARRSRNGLTLTSVPGETNAFSFTSAGSRSLKGRPFIRPRPRRRVTRSPSFHRSAPLFQERYRQSLDFLDQPDAIQRLYRREMRPLFRQEPSPLYRRGGNWNSPDLPGRNLNLDRPGGRPRGGNWNFNR